MFSFRRGAQARCKVLIFTIILLREYYEARGGPETQKNKTLLYYQSVGDLYKGNKKSKQVWRKIKVSKTKNEENSISHKKQPEMLGEALCPKFNLADAVIEFLPSQVSKRLYYTLSISIAHLHPHSSLPPPPFPSPPLLNPPRPPLPP